MSTTLTDKEIQQLLLENIRLKANKIQHCKGCGNLQKHPCGVFHFCPMLGIVDPLVDGCSKRL